MNEFFSYKKNIRFPFQSRKFKKTRGVCSACGVSAKFQYFDVITDRLANEWEINEKLKKQYSIRESMHCSKCRCSARLRALAKAITLVYGKDSESLKENIENGVFSGKKVAEINACGDLHKILINMPKLAYSEYAPDKKSISTEDLQKLTYKSNIFDLVLTSDTLEHVPNYRAALSEINRILRPGGYHIFTIPLIFSRKTRRRITIKYDKIIPTLDHSYHGAGEPDNLVATEFGIDFLNELKEEGFVTEIYFGNPLDKNDVNYVLVSRKV